MSAQLLGWMIVVGVLVYVLYRLIWNDRASSGALVTHDMATYESTERPFMPAEIAAGVLVASEQYFRTRYPKPLGAQVDQVYATREGYLVPVETKRRYRNRPTEYDVIELSTQAAVLRTARPKALENYQVATWGYVRVVNELRHPTYLRVSLLNDEQLVHIYNRYWDLQNGRVHPGAAAHVGICRKCAFLERCPNPVSA
jgi:CRISPR/Cas system-associated exonuclease Cas4 (RecB family)